MRTFMKEKGSIIFFDGPAASYIIMYKPEVTNAFHVIYMNKLSDCSAPEELSYLKKSLQKP